LLLKLTEMWKTGNIKAFSVLLRSGMINIYIFFFSALKKKWQGKDELLSQLEVQVKQMKEGFDMKEKKLIEERNKSLQAQR